MQPPTSAVTTAEGQIALLQALNTPLVVTRGASRVAEGAAAEARQQEVEEQEEQMMQSQIAGLTQEEQPASPVESMTHQSPPLARVHGGCSVLTERYACCRFCTCHSHHVASA